jgi:hypothetical protein
VKNCKQCGAPIAEGWPPCCPRPSDCWQRYIRGLPPRKPNVAKTSSGEGNPHPDSALSVAPSSAAGPCPASSANQVPPAAATSPTETSRVPRRRYHFKPDSSLNPVSQLMARIVDRLEGSGRRLGWRDLYRCLNGSRYSNYDEAIERLRLKGAIKIDPKSRVVTLLRFPGELFPPKKAKRRSKGRQRSQRDLEQRAAWLGRKVAEKD